MVGVVVSHKMNKTVIIGVDRRIQHAKYKKHITRTHRFKAHDEKNECQVGDKVVVQESCPISKDKHWRVSEILEKATGIEVAEA